MIDVQKGEKILYQGRPSNLLLFTRLFSILGFTLLIITVYFIFLINPTLKFLESTDFDSLDFLLILFLVILVLTFIYNILVIKTFEYYITTSRVIFEGGILTRRNKIIPFNKITHVEVSRNIIEQIFHLSSLHVQTASVGTIKSEITFEGLLDANTPERILAKHIKRDK